MLEIKRHEWKENGENHASPFFVWVDGQPRFDLSDCKHCRHYRVDNPCAMVVQVGGAGDEKLHPFCGRVCGYFDMKPGVTHEDTNQESRTQDRLQGRRSVVAFQYMRLSRFDKSSSRV
jgi:hypothetical protein